MYPDRYADLFSECSELNSHRYVLQDQYLELTRTTLPGLAKANQWEITEDHCFMRIILDQLFEDCWYHHLDKRLVAYKQLTETQLKIAIALAQALVEQGESLLNVWNRQSLHWRQR